MNTEQNSEPNIPPKIPPRIPPKTSTRRPPLSSTSPVSSHSPSLPTKGSPSQVGHKSPLHAPSASSRATENPNSIRSPQTFSGIQSTSQNNATVDSNSTNRCGTRPMPPVIPTSSGRQSNIRSTRSTARRAPHAPAAVQPRRPLPQAVKQEFSLPDVNNPETPRTSPMPEKRRKKAKRKRILVSIGLVLLLLVASSLIWVRYVIGVADSKFNRVDALSTTQSTPGTTYIIAGSDARTDGGVPPDGTEGQRSDSILLLHIPNSGSPALVSLPRDIFVDIPGEGAHKINATFSLSGPKGLVTAVETLSGLHVDHYVQIGMGGVKNLVDLVGGVELCYDATVNDRDSGLVWEAGCHPANGDLALAFSRMRKSDPQGDIGRAQRQQQVMKAVMKKALSVHYLLPWNTIDFVKQAAPVLTLDQSSGVWDVYRALQGLSQAAKDGTTGIPPIADNDHYVKGLGSTVLLDKKASATFWENLKTGNITKADFGEK